jgi:hypothetical protein
MSTSDIAWQMEADDLAQAKNLVQMILQDWDFMTWNEVLAYDVVLSLKLGATASIGSAILAESAGTCRSPAAKMPSAC